MANLDSAASLGSELFEFLVAERLDRAELTKAVGMLAEALTVDDFTLPQHGAPAYNGVGNDANSRTVRSVCVHDQ